MIRKDYLENLSYPPSLTSFPLERIVNGLLAEQERFIKENSILNVLLREQKQIETSLENIMAAIEQGVITNTTTKRLKELEARQEELDQILIERSKNAVRVSAEEIREYYKAALALEAQMLVNYLVKDIVLYDDKIEIYFNKPTRTSPDEDRGFSVFTGTADNIEIEIII